MATTEWQRFFREEAERYLRNDFTRNTVSEVDFIIRELGVKPGQCFLDVGCGTARHSLELARRGHRCTGIDLSADMLAVGRKTALEEGLEIELIQGDASATRLRRRFDHAICLCEGAFSLLEIGADPVQYHAGILRNIRSMLRPGGMFLLTALNGYRLAREHTDADVASGHFDIMSTAHREALPAGSGSAVLVIEKGFMPAELAGLLEGAGFRVRSIWGGTAGGWNKASLQLDEIEIMVIATKT